MRNGLIQLVRCKQLVDASATLRMLRLEDGSQKSRESVNECRLYRQYKHQDDTMTLELPRARAMRQANLFCSKDRTDAVSGISGFDIGLWTLTLWTSWLAAKGE